MSDSDILELGDELETAIKVSDHGVKRLRQRLGLNKSSVDREVARALEKGTPRTELTGRMRRTLDAMWHKYGHYGDYRVYRGHVFIFKGNNFVTVIGLTNGLHNTKAGGRGK